MNSITIIYDNTSVSDLFTSDWGFSCLIEFNDKKILFDAGANGKILMENMKKLNINPKAISDVFLSHNHFDHIGGLSAFLNANNDVIVHVPPSLRGIRYAKKVIYYDKPTKIYKNIYTTGELENIEHSMILKTHKGLIVVTGCSHPKMKDILNTANKFGKIHAVVGGLHGFNKFDLFENLSWFCPTHCTQYQKELGKLFSEKIVTGGVGKIIKIEESKNEIL